MFYKNTFRVVLCVFLLSIASCTEQEAVTVGQTSQVQAAREVAASSGSEMIIRLGDKEFTKQHANWMRPDSDDFKMAELANWWYETELLYAEAERRGLTKEGKMMFVSELKKKQNVAQELIKRVRESVVVSEKEIKDYYEENKETDIRLKEAGNLSFTHVRTKTAEEAAAVLKRIKAGEDISELARELSIYRDARNGGVVSNYVYRRVEGRFGEEFFEALKAAEQGKIIGPIVNREGTYEVARQNAKTEAEILPFEKVSGLIESNLQQTKMNEVTIELLGSLKEKAAKKVEKSALMIEAEEKARKRQESPQGGQK